MKVKESLAATGNNNTSQLLLMLVQYVIKVRPKVAINVQNTSTEELKNMAQRHSKLRDVKITNDSVSYLGYTKGDKESSSGGKSSDQEQE